MGIFIRFARVAFSVFFIFSASVFTSSAQWMDWETVWDNSNSTYDAVVSPSDSVFLVAGHGGEILRSTDDGKTWNIVRERRPAPSDAKLVDISFGTPKFGMAVGRFGEVVTTVDGGLTWTSQALGGAYVKIVIHVVDENFAFIVGTPLRLVPPNSRLWTTRNGGRTWDSLSLSSGDTSSLFWVGDIWMFDSLRGIVLNMFAAPGNGILRTEDGGRTWNPIFLDSTVGSGFRAMDFVDGKHGLILGGSGQVLYTRDGGATWAKRGSEIKNLMVDIAMLDTLHAIAVGPEDRVCGIPPIAASSIDGGKSWQEKWIDNLFHREAPTSVAVSRTGTAIVVTGEGGPGRVHRSVLFSSSSAETTSLDGDKSLTISTGSADGQVVVEFDLYRPADVNVSIVDMLGREVMRADLGLLESGFIRRMLDISYLPSGTYYLAIETPTQVMTGSFRIVR